MIFPTIRLFPLLGFRLKATTEDQLWRTNSVAYPYPFTAVSSEESHPLICIQLMRANVFTPLP
jgi:hypothetical protein